MPLKCEDDYMGSNLLAFTVTSDGLLIINMEPYYTPGDCPEVADGLLYEIHNSRYLKNEFIPSARDFYKEVIDQCFGSGKTVSDWYIFTIDERVNFNK